MTIETLGIDIAKNVFQLHGVSPSGRVVLKRRVMRDQLLEVVAQIDRCTIVIEACTGAFCWARKFEVLGHRVRIISPQYVKPFVRRQKNDGNDAEAICIAARRAHIPFVPNKTVEQQDIQALHRARQRMVNHRTAVVSQIRGLLLDRGFAMAKSITRARRLVPEILADMSNELTALARQSQSFTICFETSIGELHPSTRRSIEYSSAASSAGASPPSRVLAPRRPLQSLRPSAMDPSSKMDAIWRPGLGSFHGSFPAATGRS
jgi:hypothetical protein